MSSRRNPGVRINIYFFSSFFVLAIFSHCFWSAFSLRLSWAVNKAPHTFLASALAAGELWKRLPWALMSSFRQSAAKSLELGCTISPNIAQKVQIQSAEKEGMDTKLTTLLLHSTLQMAHTWAWAVHGHGFVKASFKTLTFWRGDTSVSHPNEVDWLPASFAVPE